jgi:Na+-driven multidrug efflux pump
MVVILAIAEITLLMLINKSLLNAMSSPMEHSGDPILSIYYQKVHDLQIDYANTYTMFLIGLLLLTFLVVYFTTLVKSEGRFKIIVIASVSCNILNIGLSIIFIYVARVGIAGAGVASLISYIVNMTILVFYVKYLIKKNDT